MRKLFALFFVFIAFSTTGCQPLVQQTGYQSHSAQSNPVGEYRDFEEVLIPHGMRLDPKNSTMVQTPQYKTGILTYKSDGQAKSLVNFFERHMAKDNWQMRSKFNYGNRTIMMFEKLGRDCLINIEDGTMDSIVEILVAPHLNNQ